jgi:hypothetical protein
MVSPFGGIPPDEVTVAVKVIAWPTIEGFSEEASVVVVWFRGVELFSRTPTEPGTLT